MVLWFSAERKYSWLYLEECICYRKQKQKYRGIFETQKSGDKTSSGEHLQVQKCDRSRCPEE